MKLSQIIPKNNWTLKDEVTFFKITHPEMPEGWFISLDKITLSGEIRREFGNLEDWKRKDLFQWVLETKVIPKLYKLVYETFRDQETKRRFEAYSTPFTNPQTNQTNSQTYQGFDWNQRDRRVEDRYNQIEEIMKQAKKSKYWKDYWEK